MADITYVSCNYVNEAMQIPTKANNISKFNSFKLWIEIGHYLWLPDFECIHYDKL